MTAEMKFSDLVCCPFCGSPEFFERRRAHGSVFFRMRFDGEETHNEGMYDGLSYEHSGKRWCSECERYLGDQNKDVVGAAARRKLDKKKGAPL